MRPAYRLAPMISTAQTAGPPRAGRIATQRQPLVVGAHLEHDRSRRVQRGRRSRAVAGNEMQADYVVVGAGSAGCVLANRLSEDGSRVVLLEAGPKDWHPMIHVPAGVLKLLYNPRVNWNYTTDPEPGIAGRQMHWPRGRVLGGSSSINGMLWIRGNPADYDGWSQMGCKGWSFDEVLPLFQVDRALCAGRGRAARQERPHPGRGLPHDPGSDPSVRRCRAAGRPAADQGPQRPPARGRRLFADVAQRPLPRLDGTHLSGAGDEAGRTCASRPRRSPPGCCSTASAAWASPSARTARIARWWPRARSSCRAAPSTRRICCRSQAIGPAAHLKSIGVAVVHDLPGVGANLSDHYAIRISHRVKDAVSINELSRGCGWPARSPAG